MKPKASAQQARAEGYLFLNPDGHFGFTPETFLMLLPLIQVMVILAAAGLAAALGVEEELLVAVTGACSWVSLMRIVGEEKVKFFALRFIQPSFIESVSVEISCSPPPELKTDTDALIGALEKP